MVVNIAKKRELVSRILGVGANRIRFEPDRLEDVADSITRDNIRSLVKAGAIWTVQPQGTSRGRATEKRSVWKVHGKGPGSKKGKKTARVGKKAVYVVRIRSMRSPARSGKGSQGPLGQACKVDTAPCKVFHHAVCKAQPLFFQ
jgi:large subunit ribosomal protein L19e